MSTEQATTGEHVEIECPGHGPMARVYALGALRLIQCRTCGKQPIDLLALAHIGRRPNLVTDHAWQPVRGHDDDPECSHRSDGTDATYCGRPEHEHEHEESTR